MWWKDSDESWIGKDFEGNDILLFESSRCSQEMASIILFHAI
jgi:hypothetical protein